MKALALSLATAAALALTAGTADAQYRYRGTYVTPTYSSYPSYSYSTPSYYTGNGIVLTSGYSSTVAPPVYPGWNYYNPAAWAPRPVAYPSYSYPVYSNYGYSYGSRGRGWRW